RTDAGQAEDFSSASIRQLKFRTSPFVLSLSKHGRNLRRAKASSRAEETVIPAKTGIHSPFANASRWVPAFAGTNPGRNRRLSRWLPASDWFLIPIPLSTGLE